jgi:hypothetical protein
MGACSSAKSKKKMEKDNTINNGLSSNRTATLKRVKSIIKGPKFFEQRGE